MSLPEGSYTQAAYVVFDLEAAIDAWARTLGAGPFFVFDSPVDDKIYRGKPGSDTNLAAMGFLGGTNIEIFQPVNDAPSMYREVLETTGEGAHHVIPRMRPMTDEDFDRACAGYEALGLELSTSGTVPGVGRIAFYDARDRIGQFIEVIQLSRETYPVMDLMHDAHVDWDGKDPLRPFSQIFR